VATGPPDALFAVTDWVAMGAVRALHAAGLQVPVDVAVMGFDDIPYARDLSPSLTSIRPDRAAIAQGALDLLETQMSENDAQGRGAGGPGGAVDPGGADDPVDSGGAGGPQAPRRIVPFTLVERESTQGRGGVP
jgi:ABC-type sugar transport system substrate-binding protein